MAPLASPSLPEGIFSFLDTDLYKLTMQCAILKYFPDVEVTYEFTNRTSDMKLNRIAFHWLQIQIEKLGNITTSDDEIKYLRNTCRYLSDQYLRYMKDFRLRPSEQVELSFHPIEDTDSEDDCGDVVLRIKGLWVETILYEIPLLALTSEAYFKFVDRDWDYHGQVDNAKRKGLVLLEHGCIFSEFGSRRRRDYHTQELVMEGLLRAATEGVQNGFPGKFTGTSNVHFAKKFGVSPVGTVAHEWFMGVAAVTNDYENASEVALRYWIGTFGEGVLGIALTDTFGTAHFLEAFKKPIPTYTSASQGPTATSAPMAGSTTVPSRETLSQTQPPLRAPPKHDSRLARKERTYAEVFTGTRQDSGDPKEFVKTMRKFYDQEGIQGKKIIVFSDSLNVERCLEYKDAADEAGFQPSFGVGTFFTNDFVRLESGKKSIPLNIVIKLSSAGGRPAIKLSDNIGKNTGDKDMVEDVKQRVGYVEQEWKDGDEKSRWGVEGDKPT
ncbi:nicotinate phosphoribosyltransferase [Viridothelium virens]|uniref:Nicotinate phosphoribosyltransferase n=1 Tax=Viridothelium virens TaxID=1048519 RepID=A0A6A6HCS1_VIRVR|nr:nicotinate phosphoribosyltransferase [Viridothelium virens]